MKYEKRTKEMKQVKKIKKGQTKKKHKDIEILQQSIENHPHKETILSNIHKKIRLNFSLKDLLQVVVGASVLAIPVGFTQEVWELGSELHFLNIASIFIISILFISLFAYYNYYRGHMKNHYTDFIKRVFFTYAVSFLVVALLLLILEKALFTTDFYVALKRTILVTFPCSMGAVFADNFHN